MTLNKYTKNMNANFQDYAIYGINVNEDGRHMCFNRGYEVLKVLLTDEIIDLIKKHAKEIQKGEEGWTTYFARLDGNTSIFKKKSNRISFHAIAELGKIKSPSFKELCEQDGVPVWG